MLTNTLLKISTALLLLTSCETKTHLQQETFKMFLPDSANIYEPQIKFEELQLKSKELKLPQLNKGADSFSLRIWQSSRITRKTVVSVSFTNAKWLATSSNFYETSNKIDSFTTQDFSSKVTSTLIDSLFSFDFINIPSQYDIPGFDDKMKDGVGFSIEIFNKHFYKLVIYHCPNRYPAEPNNKKIMDLINLLDNYFHFYTPYCGSEQ